MKKFITLTILFFLLILSVDAKSIDRRIDSQIRNSGINKSSIAISIKDIDKNRVVYKLNDNILMHPASVQKLLTIVPVMEVLGDDYKLSTTIYQRGDNGYLIKLGADPYLSSSDLENLVKKINREKITTIYIDDTVIEPKDWGEGWQWDDDLNVSMPRFNSYNLDGNVYKLTIMPTEKNKQAQIINQNKIPLSLYNNILTGDKNNISIFRDNINAPNILKLDGTVSRTVVKTIPNNNLKKYFDYKLKTTLEDNRIYLKNPYVKSSVKSTDGYVFSISHPIEKAVEDVLLNSNNMVIESISKLGGSKYYKKQGTDKDVINLCNEYFQKQGLDYSRIRLVDSSGVSKNNLVDADFISEFLLKNKDNSTLKNMAAPGQGTLTGRMLPIKDNLKAKTGTLSDISSIAGYVTSKNGRKYAFCIIINDPQSTNSEKKGLEDYIIREMYMNL